MTPLLDHEPPYGTVVFDCDSTLSTIEGIDELCDIVGVEAADVAELTTRAMAGELPLEEVYARRLELLRPDAAALETLCDQLELRFEERDDGLHTIANGHDVSHEIRSAAAGDYASKVSVTPIVRERLVALQRSMGERRPTVMEGRDIGTVVFPDAPLKVFLRATVAERARRRCIDLAVF